MSTRDHHPLDGWIALALGAAAVIAVVLAISPYPVGVFQDDGAYVVLAKSLAQGQGYRFINLPNEPAATHFPPLYPFLLAALWKIAPEFPANLPWFRAANALLLGAVAAAAYLFARRQLRLAPWLAALGAGLSAVCAPVVWMAGLLLSEPLFLALLFPALWLAERALRTATARAAAVAALAIGVLSLTRSLGVLLLVALLTVFLVRRQWRAAAAAAVAGAAVQLPWLWWILQHGDAVPPVLMGKYGSYLGWVLHGVRDEGMDFVLQVAAINVQATAAFAAASFGLSPASAVRWLAFAIVALVFAAGMRRVLANAPVTAVFVAFYLGIVLVWPFPPDRFFWGIWPLLGLVVATGLRDAFAMLPRERTWRLAGAAAVGLVVALYAGPHIATRPRLWVGNVPHAVSERSAAALHWVRTATGPDDVVATEDDLMIYLYTARRTVPAGTFTPQEYVQPQDAAIAALALHALVDAYEVRWVVPTTEMGVRASLSLAQQTHARLVFRGALERGAVFERVPETSP